MLKKQIAFIALLLFFLSQFGRMINYSYCKIAVYQQTNTFVCDCEKMLYTAIKTDNTSKEQAPQNISAQASSEELFHPVLLPVITRPYTLLTAHWPLQTTGKRLFIFTRNIFHPPLQVC